MAPDNKTVHFPIIISGRFEFLHPLNVVYILYALEQHSGLPTKPVMKLLPGSDDWFIPDLQTRAEFLNDFRFRLDIQTDTTPTGHMLMPVSLDKGSRLLESFYKAKADTSYFRNPTHLIEKIFANYGTDVKIVTTNGCFDILHPGHLKTLQFARSQGDILVVAINSDRSIQRFKGPSRPIHRESFRGSLLAQLPYVDFVTVFDEDTPLNLIAGLKPQVHVKGGSFLDERVREERELLTTWGGHLIAYPMVGEFSTTRILEIYNPHTFPI